MNPDSLPLEAQSLLSETTWIRSLARGIVADSAAADDVAQEALLVSLRGARPQAGTPRRAWMSGVLRNLAWKRGRSEARRGARERRAARREDLPATADLVARAELQRMVTDSVLTLEEPYRSTILLRFFEGHSSAEIARAQGQVEATVRWRVQRGIELLRGDLEQRGGQEWLASCAFLAGLLPHAPQAAGAAVKGAALGGVSFLPAAGLTTAALVGLGMGVAWHASDSRETTELASAELARAAVEAPAIADVETGANEEPQPLQPATGPSSRIPLGPETPLDPPVVPEAGERPPEPTPNSGGTRTARRHGHWATAGGDEAPAMEEVRVLRIVVVGAGEARDLNADISFEEVEGAVRINAKDICDVTPAQILGEVCLDENDGFRQILVAPGTSGDRAFEIDNEVLRRCMNVQGDVRVQLHAGVWTTRKP